MSGTDSARHGEKSAIRKADSVSFDAERGKKKEGLEELEPDLPGAELSCYTFAMRCPVLTSVTCPVLTSVTWRFRLAEALCERREGGGLGRDGAHVPREDGQGRPDQFAFRRKAVDPGVCWPAVCVYVCCAAINGSAAVYGRTARRGGGAFGRLEDARAAEAREQSEAGAERESERGQTETETDRHTDTHTQTHRHTDTQTHTHRHRHRQTCSDTRVCIRYAVLRRLCYYAFATRCPVDNTEALAEAAKIAELGTRPPIVLRRSYAKSGTDIGYPLRSPVLTWGTLYRPTPLLCDVRLRTMPSSTDHAVQYWPRRCCYQTMRCAVLTEAMPLPGEEEWRERTRREEEEQRLYPCAGATIYGANASVSGVKCLCVCGQCLCLRWFY
eukprot:1887039-Rhodomonas_salina.1